MSIFDVDDPEIRVELAFAGDDLRGRGAIDPVFVMKPREPSHTIITRLALRRGSKDGHAAIKTIQYDENSPGFCCAPFAQRAERAFNCAAPQVS